MNSVVVNGYHESHLLKKSCGIELQNLLLQITPETRLNLPIQQAALYKMSRETCQSLKDAPPVRFEEMEFLPWDNPDNIVTAEVENIVRRVKDTLLFIMFLIGGPANIINMAVYYKQGLKERVNLCLFALSLADELYLIQVMFIYGEQIHLQFTTQERYGPVVRFMANNNLAGFFAFSFVSQILSAIIASERCLCVLSPLRFQTLLQTRTVAVIIVAVYVVPLGF